MANGVAAFKKALASAAEKVKAFPSKEATLVFHDDGDGVASGAVCMASLERAGFKINPLCIEKLLPELIEKLHSERGKLIVYADIGSGQIKAVCKANEGKNLAVILDHHDTEESTDSEVLNVNPELFGLSGEANASGSVVCYLFAKALDERNKNLALLAVVGLQEIPKPSGETAKEVKEDAGKVAGAAGIHKALTILASTGYYSKGPELALSACLNGFTKELKRKAEELEKKRAAANRKLLLEIYKKRLNQSRHVQWFHAGNAFKGMGVKVVGIFCSYLSFQRIASSAKYLLGFMPMQREIPGFGRLKQELTKVSMRAPRELAAQIQAGKAASCVELLAEACEALGGSADGHSVAASGVIPKGKEKELIAEIEKTLAERTLAEKTQVRK